jgi:hypothetical protein
MAAPTARPTAASAAASRSKAPTPIAERTVGEIANRAMIAVPSPMPIVPAWRWIRPGAAASRTAMAARATLVAKARSSTVAQIASQPAKRTATNAHSPSVSCDSRRPRAAAARTGAWSCSRAQST